MDIPAIAQSGVDQAWIVAESVLSAITVRQGPTVTYNATLDTQTVVWATTTTGKKGLQYQPKAEEVETGNMNAWTEGRMKYLLVRLSDFPTPIQNDSEIDMDGVTWQVKSNTPDPSNTISVLTLLR